MGVIYLFRRLVFAQVLLGIVAFCMAEPNPGMLLIAGALGALSWYVVEGPTGKPLPQWIILPGAVLAVAWLLFDLWWQHGQIIGAMGHFTMWLQILLLYAKKTNREYGEILVLSLMQMIGASVLTVSMIFGVLLAAYCVLALFTLLLFHLKATSDLVLEANRVAAPAHVDLPRPKAVACRGHKWQFRSVAMGIGAGCCFVAFFVFLVIPRSGQSQLNPNLGQGYGQSNGAGFNTSITLDGKPINAGPLTPALYVKVKKNGKSVSNSDPDFSFLLRGATMDEYSSTSHNWTRSNLGEYDRDVTVPAHLATEDSYGEVYKLEITQRGGSDASNLFSFEDKPTVYFESPDLDTQQIKFNILDHQFNTAKAFRGALHYTIMAPVSPDAKFYETYPQIDTSSGQVTQSGRYNRSRFNEENYALHWKDRRQKLVIANYTRQILKNNGFGNKVNGRNLSDEEKLKVVAFLSTYLKENFAYQLDAVDLSKDREPITGFLFTTKAGHCELFAAGLAAMLRSIDIRARVITGYRVSEYNRFGGYYVARPIHAHAWTEVELAPDVWSVYDATPPDRVLAEHTQNRSMFDPLREFYEYMEFMWVDTVVSYDAKRQKQMVSGATHTLKAVTRTPNKHITKIIEWVKNLPETLKLNKLSYSIMGVIIFLIILGVASLIHTIVVQKRRLTALQLQRLSRKDRKALAKRLKWYLNMLEMLERNGYIRPIWQSPLDFSRELARSNPNRFNPVISLTEIFYEIRFGHREMDDDRRNRVREHMRLLEHALLRRGAKVKT
ncbi:MAG: DUF3488 and DUF4129 domain-containing transglutaminase family protein [Phycisphaeraceae bacterium JB051]